MDCSVARQARELAKVRLAAEAAERLEEERKARESRRAKREARLSGNEFVAEETLRAPLGSAASSSTMPMEAAATRPKDCTPAPEDGSAAAAGAETVSDTALPVALARPVCEEVQVDSGTAPTPAHAGKDDRGEMLPAEAVSASPEEVEADEALAGEVELAVCSHCGGDADEERLLICDGCNCARHT